MFVCHPKHKKNKLDQQANASRLLPVGWIDVQLMMYLVPAQVKFEFSADLNKLYFFLKLLASNIDYHTNKCT